ncbi:armadillo-type protein [Zychaea mexicana]|uniref:armadillo-type protein n=1 Tax=Zychaea mexicana TaxID=64656 RepID=UPI0022FEEFA9|nr:armadillo-type protein [Zychaea mexicana]KAI9499281.1 armadillo-type protein [Zychaea mexicana]
MPAKVELRQANTLAWNKGKDASQYKNLDSNIKKNTTFIKKCKTSLAADSTQQLLNDIKKLSLEKYVSEVVGAVLDGMLKCKSTTDIAACVEVISALHQRFPETFTLLLTYNLAKALQIPSRQHLASLAQDQREKEESTRISRQRTYLRISVELWLAGVLRNVEDGIPSLASTSLEGVESQRDGVAGFVGSSSSTSLKTRKKDGDKEEKKGKVESNFVYRVLKGLLSSDLEQNVNLPIAASFLKNYGQEILGIVPRKQRAATQQNENPDDAAVTTGATITNIDSDSTVTPESRAMLKGLFVDYYRSVEKHLVKEHKQIKKLDHRNREILFARGELSDEIKQDYEKVSKSYEKLLNNTQTLADALDLEMPELPEEEGVTRVSIVSAGAAHAFSDTKESLANGIWEDEDARKFYEDLPDLHVLVPGVFLESNPSKKTDGLGEGTEQNDKEETTSDENPGVGETGESVVNGSVQGDDENDEKDDEDVDASDIVDKALNSTSTDKDDENGANSMPSQLAQLDGLIARLSTLGNRDLIDSAAVEFCYFNSKNARKRLVKALLNVPRQRVDLLPYYSRLIAILGQYFSDISETVLAALDHEFKGLQRKKTQDLLESRVKNIRFLSELTKFKVTPSHTIFHVFKIALDDFTHQNIDIVCNLLETCGRYLLKSPETSVRMNNMLEVVMRKKNVQHMDNRQMLMIENAYYQANPPDRTAIVEKERSPMELYVRKLIYGDLNKKSLDKILKQLRKLHWEDPDIFRMMLKIFQKVWKIKYSNVHLLAILASGLHRHHSDFGVQLIDSVIEEIRIGLEQNIFKHNQRRVAVVKYLGELYNYRMIDSPLIFDTLYTIVTLGHEFGRPARERFCPMDAPNDFFRIRLCCTLLDTCGMCFDRGSSKRKLDHFLIFFQMYIFTKAKPPMDVDFMVSDTLEMLRPQMHIISSYEEANEAVDRMLLEQLKSVQGSDGSKVQEDGFEESEEESTSDEADDDDNLDDADKDDEDEENTEEIGEEGATVDGDEDVVVFKKKQEQKSNEDDEEFEREFSRMMSESMESRKFEKKSAVLDVPIPMNLRGAQDRRTATAQEKDINSQDKMSFTLLTKKGNRQQTRTMEVPSDSILAVSTRTKQEAEREEQQQLKKLVLSYEEREEAAARQAAKEERARQRGGFRGRRILHMGGGGGGAYAGRR